jgi:GNAT acetyltransferase-like protein
MVAARAGRLIRRLLQWFPVGQTDRRHPGVPTSEAFPQDGAQPHEESGQAVAGSVGAVAATTGARLLWRDRHYEVELFETLGPERAHCEAALLAAGLPLAVQHRTEWARTQTRRTLWLLAARATGSGYQAGFGVEVSRSRAIPGHLLLRVEKFGAALSDGAREAGLRALAHLAWSRARVLRVYVEVYTPDPGVREQIGRVLRQLRFRPAAEPRTYHHTVWVDLEPDEDGILASFHRSTRRNIRQMAKPPFEVRAIVDPELTDRVGALLRESLARTGGPAQQEDLEAVRTLSIRWPQLSRLAGLFRTDIAGPEALVAVAWGLNHGDYVDNPATGMTRLPGSRAPLTYALIWDLIRWAKRVGARWFDLGGVTLGEGGTGDSLRGISAFKRGFSDTIATVGEEWTLEPNLVHGRLATALSSVSSLAQRVASAAAHAILLPNGRPPYPTPEGDVELEGATRETAHAPRS